MASNPNRGEPVADEALDSMPDRMLVLDGRVTPPADMIAAAAASLPPEHFHALMQQTGGLPPTSQELVNLVEALRNVPQA